MTSKKRGRYYTLVREYQRLILSQAIQAAGGRGRITRAAQALGLGRSYIHVLIQRLGVEVPPLPRTEPRSRRARWRQARLDRGLCTCCGRRPLTLYSHLCDRCYQRQNQGRRRWRPGRQGRPPKSYHPPEVRKGRVVQQRQCGCRFNASGRRLVACWRQSR